MRKLCVYFGICRISGTKKPALGGLYGAGSVIGSRICASAAWNLAGMAAADRVDMRGAVGSCTG